MKKPVILIFALCLIVFSSHSQNADTCWNRFRYLVGTWVGEGSGKPGEGGGSFTFEFDRDTNILARKSHSEYPATADKPKVIHDDIMLISKVDAGKPMKAMYMDNEGHTIKYNITFAGTSIIFTSDSISNKPRYRLTYTKTDDRTIFTRFEIAAPGTPDAFSTYIEGSSRKKE